MRKTKLILGVLLLLVVVLLWSGREPERAAQTLAPLGNAAIPGVVLVVGGTRATGLEIVRLLRARGDEVVVFARPNSNVAEVENLGAKIARGNAMNTADVHNAFAANKFRAVISTLGTSGKDRPRPDFEGNKNIIDAAKAAGVKRLVLITVIGAGDSQGAEPWIAGRFLQEIIALKTQAEAYLQASGLDYTIIRPGGLFDRPAHDTAFLTADTRAFSWITRGDLAQLTVRALDDASTVGKSLHAFDPARTRFWSIRENFDK